MAAKFGHPSCQKFRNACQASRSALTSGSRPLATAAELEVEGGGAEPEVLAEAVLQPAPEREMNPARIVAEEDEAGRVHTGLSGIEEPHRVPPSGRGALGLGLGLQPPVELGCGHATATGRVHGVHVVEHLQ